MSFDYLFYLWKKGHYIPKKKPSFWYKNTTTDIDIEIRINLNKFFCRFFLSESGIFDFFIIQDLRVK